MTPIRSSLVAAGLALAVLAGPVVGSEPETSFDRTDELLTGRVDWVAVSAERLAFGADDRVLLGRTGPPLLLDSELRVARSVIDAVLAVDLLYLAGANGSLDVLDLSVPNPSVVGEPLSPPSSGTLHLAQMDDFLVIAEDGAGLRILRIPPRGHPPMPGMESHDHGDHLQAVSFLPLPHTFDAVVALGRKIYAAVRGQGLVVVDAREPTGPVLEHWVPFEAEVADLGANGDALYVLTREGLEKLHIGDASLETAGRFADLAGNALHVSGRRLIVASPGAGLAGLFDASSTAATFTVQMGDSFFNPLNLTINLGDTVTWQKPVTIEAHNVFSCTAAEPGCNGATSNELFVSGAVTAAPLTFSHTFVLAGSNPYLCQTHFFLASMQGEISVNGPPPPAVPALAVDRLTADGSRLQLQWNAVACGSTEHHVLFGLDSGLPTAPGNTYGLAGGVCGVGSSPFLWNGVPALAPNQLLWFLILSDEGSSVEGSWGLDSFGAERNGAGVGGSSGQCGILGKDLTNVCGL